MFLSKVKYFLNTLEVLKVRFCSDKLLTLETISKFF
jgi:hypothetical protein